MSPMTLLKLTAMIAHVHCWQWERMYDGTWRAEGEAIIYFEGGGTLVTNRVDVATGTDLHDTLEAFCRTDVDSGVSDN